MDYAELKQIFRELKRTSPRDDLTAHVIFTEDSFKKHYSLLSRTYCISSDNKAFWPNMGGYSIFGYCLDKTSDQGVRLDYYMAEEQDINGWKVEDCYILEQMRDTVAIPSLTRMEQDDGTVCFFLTDLKRYGLYYYRKKSFTNNPYDRLFVLFQYDGLLVGCGEKVYQKQEKTGDYSGYYEFDTNTVRLFDKPMTAGEFLPLVDNTINGFSQTLHKIDLQYLDRIVSYINLNCFESDIETAIIEATKCNSKTGSEGKRVSYYGTRYERDPNLRKVAIDFCRQKNGALICEACQINYEGLYGEFGSSVIEVHHLKPLGEIRSEHNVNPETDMVCLCANCHKMIHHAIRKIGYSLTAEELRNTVLTCADDKVSP